MLLSFAVPAVSAEQAQPETSEEALDSYENNQKALKKLIDYYGSSLWMKDFEDDENGKLPKDLKRGVLSEDSVYDLITKHHEIVLRMTKIISKAIEGQML